MTFLKRYQSVALAKQDVQHFPFEEYAEASLEQLEQVAEQHKLQQFNSWMLPQLLANFAKWRLIRLPDTNKIDAKLTILANCEQDLKQRGMFLVASKLPRSKLVKRQNSELGAHYGALVPLILAAHKKFNQVPYKDWCKSTVKYCVDKNLAQAMLLLPNDIPQLSWERLLEIRQQGLIVKSGSGLGSQKDPISTWALTGIQDTELGHLPKLAVTMLTQIWLAHPSLRNQYMVLDPINWDHMPAPLLGTEVFTDQQKLANQQRLQPAQSSQRDDIAWLA